MIIHCSIDYNPKVETVLSRQEGQIRNQAMNFSLRTREGHARLSCALTIQNRQQIFLTIAKINTAKKIMLSCQRALVIEQEFQIIAADGLLIGIPIRIGTLNWVAQ